MILDERARAVLEAARSATLATIAPDGRPRLVPVCFVVVDGGPDGHAVLYSPLDDKPKAAPAATDPHELARVRDLVARPHTTLLVDRWSEDWDRLAWLRIEARAELIEPSPSGSEHAVAVAALRTKYPQYATHHLEERPIIRFTVDRAVAWGDLGDA